MILARFLFVFDDLYSPKALHGGGFEHGLHAIVIELALSKRWADCTRVIYRFEEAG